MVTFYRSSLPLLCIVTAIHSRANSFTPILQVFGPKKAVFRAPSQLESSTSNDDNNNLREAAKAPLLWETIEARESKAVLNLSNFINEELLNAEQPDENVLLSSEACWDQWETTRARLEDMGIIHSKEDEDTLLKAVPQLLRLDTDIVLDSYQAIMNLVDDKSIILQEPRLLSFKGEDIEYGVEFLSIMMASPISVVVEMCRTNPKLLQSGAEGGLQEQSVKRALGAAANATQSANKRIAANAAASLRSLRQRKPPGM
jgi:hypothetical protein